MSADRASFLIDADEYFSTVADAIERAARSVVIIGWDLNTEVRLRRDGREPATLAEVLLGAVRRNRRLQVWILLWDYALIYLLERQPLPLLGSVWLRHRRIRVRHDDTAPAGASHHQKLVVIDEQMAFVGGIDLTVHRWDTRAHLAVDERRADAGRSPYTPFHDAQLAVDGAAARALAELARERWRAAARKRLPKVSGTDDPWPPDLQPDLRNVTVAIARTFAEREGRKGIHEVEQLYLDSVGAAKECIYTAGPERSRRQPASAARRSEAVRYGMRAVRRRVTPSCLPSQIPLTGRR